MLFWATLIGSLKSIIWASRCPIYSLSFLFWSSFQALSSRIINLESGLSVCRQNWRHDDRLWTLVTIHNCTTPLTKNCILDSTPSRISPPPAYSFFFWDSPNIWYDNKDIRTWFSMVLLCMSLPWCSSPTLSWRAILCLSNSSSRAFRSSWASSSSWKFYFNWLRLWVDFFKRKKTCTISRICNRSNI